MVFETMSFSSGEFSILSMACPERTGCVQAAKTALRPVRGQRFGAEDQGPGRVDDVVEQDAMSCP